jgi:hypothetical protein
MTARYDAFGGPHQRFAAATRTQLMGANAFHGGPIPITPNRTSFQFSNRRAIANPRLNSASNQRFFQSSQFRTQGFRSPAASGNGVGTVHGVSPNIANRPSARPSPSTASRPSASGWQRFGDPGNGGALRQSFTNPSESSGWHSFGQPRPLYSTPNRGAQQPQRYNAPSYSAPRYNSVPHNNAPSYTAPRSNNTPRYTAPNYSSPNYNSAPRYSAPSYTAPRNNTAPRYTAPTYNAPHYSAPRNSAPASRPSNNGGSFHGNSGGGGHPSGGGGHNGGGGGHRR